MAYLSFNAMKEKSHAWWKNASQDSQLRDRGFCVNNSHGVNFLVDLPNDSPVRTRGVVQVSCCCPPNVPDMYELALFDKYNMVYIDELEYNDVQRFETIAEATTELLRIANFEFEK